MAKRSSTIYLEDKFWDMLTDYQNENNLTSRNDALQLILNEWSILKQFDMKNMVINIPVGTIVPNQIETNNDKINSEEKIDKERNPVMDNGIKSIFGSMK